VGASLGPAALALIVVSGCAHGPPRPRTPAPAFLSSLDAVMSHAAELGLTPEQLDKLDAIEARRERRDADSLAAFAPRKTEAASAEQPQTEAPPVGSGRHGGGRGGGHRGGMGGGRHHPAPPHSNDAKVQDALDQHDTEAFTEGLAVFTDEQRPRAIEWASQYRAQLFDSRAP
jgi:hypothetical protein